MKHLFDLPSELLAEVFNILVTLCGIRTAVKKRMVCKAFNSQIDGAILVTKALEDQNIEMTCIGRELLSKYLLALILADGSRDRRLTLEVFESLNYISDHTTSNIVLNADSIQAACLAIARASSRETYLYYFRNPKPRNCLPAQNALAIAASAGWVSVVRELIEKGVQDCSTMFGYALIHVARYGTAILASEYLNSRLHIQQHNSQDKLSIIANSTSLNVENSNRSQISQEHYVKAINHAVQANNTATLNLIIEAAEHDGQLDVPPRNKQWWPFFDDHKSVRCHLQDYIFLVAARANQFDLAKMALDQGANPDAKWSFRSIFEEAALSLNPMIVRLLLEYGADPELCRLKSPLTSAVSMDLIKYVRVYLEAGLTNFSRTSPGDSDGMYHPLLVAARKRSARSLRLLLEYGICFEVGSELDQAFPSYNLLDPETAKILADHRQAQKSTLG